MPWVLMSDMLLLVAWGLEAHTGEDLSSDLNLAQSVEVTKAVEGSNHLRGIENPAV